MARWLALIAVMLFPDGLAAQRLELAEAWRRGEGPGDVRMPATVGWRNDTLWVADAALRRVSALMARRSAHSPRPRPW